MGIEKIYQGCFLWLVLFHKKGNDHEITAKLGAKSLYRTAMAIIKIPKGKLKEINVNTKTVGMVIITPKQKN